MIAQTKRQGEHGMGWVGKAGTRKDGAAADVGVGQAVEAQIGVDDAGRVRRRHAHAAHVVVAVIATFKEIGAAGHQIFVGHNASYTGEGALGDQNILADGLQFPLGDLPVEADAEEAQRVALVGEGDAAVGGGLLFAVDAEQDTDR